MPTTSVSTRWGPETVVFVSPTERLWDPASPSCKVSTSRTTGPLPRELSDDQIVSEWTTVRHLLLLSQSVDLTTQGPGEGSLGSWDRTTVSHGFPTKGTHGPTGWVSSTQSCSSSILHPGSDGVPKSLDSTGVPCGRSPSLGSVVQSGRRPYGPTVVGSG